MRYAVFPHLTSGYVSAVLHNWPWYVFFGILDSLHSPGPPLPDRYFSSRTLQAVTTVGTPYYMSPEAIKGQPYDFSSDVWSMGCLLYELAALRNPFFKVRG